MGDKDASAELEALVAECRSEADKSHRRGKAYYPVSYTHLRAHET